MEIIYTALYKIATGFSLLSFILFIITIVFPTVYNYFKIKINTGILAGLWIALSIISGWLALHFLDLSYGPNYYYKVAIEEFQKEHYIRALRNLDNIDTIKHRKKEIFDLYKSLDSTDVRKFASGVIMYPQSELNIRNTPDTKSQNIVDKLLKNEKILISSVESNGFVQISDLHGKYLGWVSKRYLSEVSLEENINNSKSDGKPMWAKTDLNIRNSPKIKNAGLFSSDNKSGILSRNQKVIMVGEVENGFVLVANLEGTELGYVSVNYLMPKPYSSSELMKFEEDEKKRSQEQSEYNRIAKQFSSWDGSHYKLKAFIKNQLKDPDSFKHLETVYKKTGNGETLIVCCSYTATNSFGGRVRNEVCAETRINDGVIIKVLSGLN